MKPQPLTHPVVASAMPLTTADSSTPSRVAGAASSNMPGPCSQKVGMLYAFQFSEDLGEQATGMNLSRYAANKPLYPLIVRNEQARLSFENWRRSRQQTLEAFFRVHSAFWQNPSPGATPSGTVEELVELSKDVLPRVEQTVHVLRKLSILGRPLAPPLAELQAEHHKLYILGHGMAGSTHLTADATGARGKISARHLAAMLAADGLSSRFDDLRIPACFSASARTPASPHPRDLDNAAVAVTRRFCGLRHSPRLPFAQQLATALQQGGFEHMTVTGYHGEGLIFSRDHHYRKLQESEEARASLLRKTFK